MDNIQNVSNWIKYEHFQEIEGLAEIGLRIYMIMSSDISRNWIHWIFSDNK